MPIPVRITYRDLERSDAIDAYVRKRASKLGTFDARIVACRVAVEAPHRHKHHGRHYRVRIELSIPGAEVVVARCPDAGRTHEDPYAAIDDAFSQAGRRLHEHARRRRADERSPARSAS
ncbi:MAG TPA: HPF/RaiA family ribosome-associated protein [Polyangiaceae bacterium]|nr:HPF/RaiA family ribosome-associated protein [Polyangiaceae bacterium]